MLFKRSVSIFMNNLDLLFKVLFYTFIMLLFSLALVVSIVSPMLKELFNNSSIIEQIGNVLKTLLNGDITSLREFFGDLTTAFHFNIGKVQIVGFLIMGVIAMLKFFLSLTYIPISTVINNKMSLGYSTKFKNEYVANFFKSLLFSLIYTLITFPLELLIFVGGYYLIIFLYPVFRIVSLTISFSIIIIMIAIRFALFSRWVPLMVIEKLSVFGALKKSFKEINKSFKRVLPSVLTLIVLLFAIIMTSSVFTFGVFPFVCSAGMLVLLNSINLTSYYIDYNKKFYLETND